MRETLPMTDDVCVARPDMEEDSMIDNHNAYYERYWQQETDVPAGDPTTAVRHTRLISTLRRLSAGSRVLDLGCGHGWFTNAMAVRGYEACGVDMSRSAIDAARQRYPGIRFETLGPQGQIPAESETFDAVWSSEVIEHVFDVHAHLAEINRVLKTGGLYILTTPYHGMLKNLLIATVKFDRHFDPEVSHIRFFDKASLTRCLGRASFRPVRWDGIGRMPGLYRTWFVVSQKTGMPGPAPQPR